MKKYANSYGSVKPAYDVNKSACEALYSSLYLPRLLEYVLLIGNILNAGSSSGKTVAFDLSVFEKVL